MRAVARKVFKMSMSELIEKEELLEDNTIYPNQRVRNILRPSPTLHAGFPER
jgi:hypothetical protein